MLFDSNVIGDFVQKSIDSHLAPASVRRIIIVWEATRTGETALLMREGEGAKGCISLIWRFSWAVRSIASDPTKINRHRLNQRVTSGHVGGRVSSAVFSIGLRVRVSLSAISTVVTSFYPLRSEFQLLIRATFAIL